MNGTKVRRRAEDCYSGNAKIENLTEVEVFIQQLRTNEGKT